MIFLNPYIWQAVLAEFYHRFCLKDSFFLIISFFFFFSYFIQNLFVVYLFLLRGRAEWRGTNEERLLHGGIITMALPTMGRPTCVSSSISSRRMSPVVLQPWSQSMILGGITPSVPSPAPLREGLKGSVCLGLHGCHRFGTLSVVCSTLVSLLCDVARDLSATSRQSARLLPNWPLWEAAANHLCMKLGF